MRPVGVAFVFLAASALLGCAAVEPPPAATTTTTPKKPAAPRYNLTGYSQPFKDGYGDACASPRRRNDQRFKNDTDYQMGWQDGSSVCRSR